MESFKIENLSFTYPGKESVTLKNISLSIADGEFVTLCGKSGCGKTTLLRLLKSSLSPYGEVSGRILFKGISLNEVDSKTQAAEIGFVMQSPDNQIVCDKVWHELAFGLESLSFSTPEIRTRVAEMASFFGIQTWFHKNVTELSGGQKQLLNLASIMAMQPSVLVLDEPTSQLDPIAAAEFLKTIQKINRELGTTVILTEHRLEEALPISDRVIVVDSGEIIADGTPQRVGEVLRDIKHDMYNAMPTPMRIYGAVESSLECPLTVRDGRRWLEDFSAENELKPEMIPEGKAQCETDVVIEVKDAWFRYEKDLPDVVKGLNVKINTGELFAILGGNGTGKTTALSLMSGLNTPYRGEVLIKGKKVSKIHNLYSGILGVLPQNPQSVFVKKTVELDLFEILNERKLSKEEKIQKVNNIAALCRIENLLDQHPYDLSGGEQQRAALAKVMLMEPEILLLDEPTKGMDAHFKAEFGEILEDLKASGVTVVMVSHDIEFCAEYADRCALFFDGNITASGEPREFFAGNSFYTTAANRMARTSLPKAVLATDIILACGGEVEKREKQRRSFDIKKREDSDNKKDNNKKKLTPFRLIAGCVFAMLFVLTSLSFLTKVDVLNLTSFSLVKFEELYIISIIEIAAAFFCFFPQREIGVTVIQQPKSDRKLTKRTIFAALLILLAVPFTIYIGTYFFGSRKYYFTSLLIILETMLPFCMVFESRKPQARELVVISVLCAIAVSGRAAFFMLPQFKPVVALVIIAGVCFGGETGFLVGAMTMVVSNMMFSQGTWTPWQMFAMGLIGFISGVLFKKGFLRRDKLSLAIFGFIMTVVVYGGIMNPAAAIMSYADISWKSLSVYYLSGLPVDTMQGIATFLFLYLGAESMLEKLDRIKVKYGLIS